MSTASSRRDVTDLAAATPLLVQLSDASLLPPDILAADPGLVLAPAPSTPPYRPGVHVHRLFCRAAYGVRVVPSIAELLRRAPRPGTISSWSDCSVCRPLLSLHVSLLPRWAEVLEARAWWIEVRRAGDALTRYLEVETTAHAPTRSMATLSLPRYRVEALGLLLRGAATPGAGDPFAPPTLPGCEDGLQAARAALAALAATAEQELRTRLPDALLTEIATWHQGGGGSRRSHQLAASLQRAALRALAPPRSLEEVLEAEPHTSPSSSAQLSDAGRLQLRSEILRRRDRRVQMQVRPRLVLLAPLSEEVPALTALPALLAAQRHTVIAGVHRRLRLCWLPGTWAHLLTPLQGCIVGHHLPAPAHHAALRERLDLLEAMGLDEPAAARELPSAWEAAGCALHL